MDLEKMLKDTTDHSNYATWQGSLNALQNIEKHILSICKDHEAPFVATKIMEYILAESKKYNDLINTTETGRILNKARGLNDHKS